MVVEKKIKIKYQMVVRRACNHNLNAICDCLNAIMQIVGTVRVHYADKDLTGTFGKLFHE